MRRGPDRSPYTAVTALLDAREVVVRAGTLADATLIASASVGRGGEARWAKHRRRRPVHGYRAHVARDQEALLTRRVEVTNANVHDAAELDAIILPRDRSGCRSGWRRWPTTRVEAGG